MDEFFLRLQAGHGISLLESGEAGRDPLRCFDSFLGKYNREIFILSPVTHSSSRLLTAK